MDFTGFSESLQAATLLKLWRRGYNQVRYGQEHYRPRSHELTTLFYDLFKRYSEDPDMSKELQEYARQRMKELHKKGGRWSIQSGGKLVC